MRRLVTRTLDWHSRLLRARTLCARTLGIAAVVALCAALPGAAQAGTVASVRPSFAPDRAGASTAFTLKIAFANQQEGIPAPVTGATVHLPAGLGIDLRSASTCPKATLQRNAGRSCPASARIGSGSALVVAHLGTLNLNENASLTAWRGPNQGGQPALEIVGQGLSPLEERVVVSGVLEPDQPPYGQQLVMINPAIPTLPLEPNAALSRFSLTVGSTHAGHAGGGLIRVPRTCPAGGFPFGADFSYADGSTSATTATVPCP
jgi:hypothetical protein